LNQEITAGLLQQAGIALGAGRYADALDLYESALRIAPDNERARLGEATCHHALGNVDRAALMFGALATAHPRQPVYRYNQGYCLLLDGRHDEALPVLEESARRLDDPHVKSNLGLALQFAKHRDLARAGTLIAAAAAALPDDATIQANLAFHHLLSGDYAAGWTRHERRASLRRTAQSTSAPLWQGEPFGGRTLGLWHEQGFGDSLQFVRYVALLARSAVAAGGRILLQPPRPLFRLFHTSLEGSAPDVEVVDPDTPVDILDWHCPLMSLPARMGTTLDTVPAEVPYLRPDSALAQAWRERLAGLPGLKVGLVWGASSNVERDPALQRGYRRRSVALADLAMLLDVPGVTFVSLQKGPQAAEADAFRSRVSFVDWTGELDDFADTAALAAGLDLVISVDTSVCHLAGAIGRPVWLLNRWDTDWRWLLDRDDSPWYPTLTLYRQDAPGDWSGAIARVTANLRALAAR
jgi:Flp pilus assembly protein TadD